MIRESMNGLLVTLFDILQVLRHHDMDQVGNLLFHQDLKLENGVILSKVLKLQTNPFSDDSFMFTSSNVHSCVLYIIIMFSDLVVTPSEGMPLVIRRSCLVK